jgi:hypothetical protein
MKLVHVAFPSALALACCGGKTILASGDASTFGQGGSGSPASAGGSGAGDGPAAGDSDAGGQGVFVGGGSTSGACSTCTCVADEAGAAWDCVEPGSQTNGEAQPTVYCALYSGPVDAGNVANVGPIERCTPQYPTCSPPYPESPGWQCCRVTTNGGVCM